MFSGEFHYKIDAKGRVSVPAQFKNASDGSFFVTRGQDGNLLVYDEAGFRRRSLEIEKQYGGGKEARSVKRMFFRGGPLQECDSHNRIRIPVQLVEFAAIDKEVVIIGMNSHFEIWSKERWEEQEEYDIGNYCEMRSDETAREEVE